MMVHFKSIWNLEKYGYFELRKKYVHFTSLLYGFHDYGEIKVS